MVCPGRVPGSCRIPPTLADDAAHDLDHERDELVTGEVLLLHEVIPGAEVKQMR